MRGLFFGCFVYRLPSLQILGGLHIVSGYCGGLYVCAGL